MLPIDTLLRICSIDHFLFDVSPFSFHFIFPRLPCKTHAPWIHKSHSALPETTRSPPFYSPKLPSSTRPGTSTRSSGHWGRNRACRDAASPRPLRGKVLPGGCSPFCWWERTARGTQRILLHDYRNTNSHVDLHIRKWWPGFGYSETETLIWLT